MTAPFRGSGPWRGRGPFLGRSPWAGKAPFGFNAGLPFQINVTGAQLRDALADPTRWGTTGSATGWLLPGLGGARLSGDCRTSVAMQTEADGTVGYAAHNLLASSEQFDDAAWTKTGLNTTGTPAWVNATIAPDGTTTAEKLIENSANTTHSLQSQSVTPSANTAYTMSVFIKAAERTFAMLQFDLGGNNTYAIVNLTTGVFGTNSGTGGITFAATSAGNGWWRCTAAGTVSTTSAGVFRAYAASNATTFSYQGDGTSGIYLWGAQLNLGPTALPYVPTTTAARFGPAIDWLAGIGAYGIRSESARTNLVTHSTQFDDAAWTKAGNTTTVVTPNTTIAPDSTLTADTITFGGSLGSDRIFQDTATAAANGTAVAGSVWLWAAAPTTVTLFVERSGPADTEFTVCSLTTTPTRFTMLHSTTWTGITNIRLRIAEKAGGGDIYAWGAQLEAGTEASSPILTFGAAATRAADTLAVLDSGWINQAAGTLVAEGVVSAISGDRTLLSLDDTTAGNRIQSFIRSDAAAMIEANVASTNVVYTNSANWSANTLNRQAVRYALNDYAISAGGAAPGTDVAATVPPMTRLALGRIVATSQPLNGHLTRIRYSRRRASDGALRSLTT